MMQVGRRVDRWLHSLSGQRVTTFGLGDEDVVNSKHGGNMLHSLDNVLDSGFSQE